MLSMNEVATQIQKDLHFYQRPSAMPLDMYLDQLLYSAMSEWIRTITFDTDPMLGSNKTGVTREYLIDRAASVLQDMTAAILGCRIQSSDAKSVVTWMVSSMQEIGELWEPCSGNLLCMSPITVSYLNRHARITGARLPDSDLIQIGLCHYEPRQVDAAVSGTFEQRQLDSEQALAKAAPEFSELSHGQAACMKELWDKYQGAFQYRNLMANILLQDAPAYMKKFLLTSGWPVGRNPVQWQYADRWMVSLL